MSSKLRPQQLRLFQALSKRNVGDVISGAEILAETGWKPATVNAYRAKHVFDPFLAPAGPGRYRVLRDGSTITHGDIAAAFTQKKPGVLVLSKGARLKGSHSDYELVASIGQGAVAHVWMATASDGSKYAIKVMNPRPDLLEPKVLENVRQRFSREARNGMNVSHSNIVKYRDHGEMTGHPFLVMDIADESLESQLKGGPVSVAQSLEIVDNCLDGLEHLHSASCTHRDIKPANILRFGDRYVLGDLGIVKWSDMNAAFTSAGTITRASLQLGSWYYMAPEQRQTPHQISARSDIYALGISWIEMLTGVTPDPSGVAARALADPTSDSAINELIFRMTSYSPKDRPSAEEVRSLVADIRKRY